MKVAGDTELDEAIVFGAIGKSRVPNQTAAVQRRMTGIQTNAAFWSQTSCVPPAFSLRESEPPPIAPKRPATITIGTRNCATVTPRFPRPLIPRAEPCFDFGNQSVTTAMEVAKFAPAMPVTADQKRRTPNGVDGSWTAIPVPMQGTRRRP
ncbi:MAG: hypothetical protein IPF66_23400 [Holophagales bacterium]|nr:hypothetical protein [Holophagales bacterium]